MKLHEYQAKKILAELGVRIPRQAVAFSPEEAESAAADFPGGCVVKAQVHSGGRGKAGGVIVCQTPRDVFLAASSLIGGRLVTKQSGENGLHIPAVLLTEKLNIEREIYLALAVDTAALTYTVIASSRGGMEIEETAKETPEQIVRVRVKEELKPYHSQYLADRLGLSAAQKTRLGEMLSSSLEYMKKNDASLIEINPLAVAEGELVAADAKITFDENALYRHPDIKALEDLSQIDPLEKQAREIGLAYVRLDGNIACMVNGAGLAMATMDIIQSCGGEPANFMDVGGGVGVEKVTAALELILRDEKVRSIFVNIFGGIARCDIIAEGIVRAAKRTGLALPLVVRLRGTHETEGRAILNSAGLDIISMEDFTEAAKMAVSCANGGRA